MQCLYLFYLQKFLRKRSQQSSSDRERELSAQNDKTENHYDSFQNHDRGCASVDNRGSFRKRPVAHLGGLEPGCFSIRIPEPRRPEWRRADASRQNGAAPVL